MGGRMRKLFLALLLALFVNIVFVSAADIYVNVNDAECDDVIGTPYCSIQAAIDAADPGDTIEVSAGTYVEQLIINKDVNLVGIDNPIIEAPDISIRQKRSISGAGSRDYDWVVLIEDVDDFTFSGFIVDGKEDGGSDRFIGIMVGNSKGTISNNEVVNIRGPSNDPSGISISGENADVLIDGNKITNFAKNGINIMLEATATVNDNIVIGGGLGETYAQNGIQFGFGATGSITGNTVSNFYYPDTWAAAGILIYGSDDVVIHGNNVNSLGNTDGILISGSPHDAWPGYGGSQNIQVTENTIKNNNYGLRVQTGSDTIDKPTTLTLVENNVFENNERQVRVGPDYDDSILDLESALLDNIFDRAVVVRENPIIVPTIFSNIQDAIDAANPSQTIEVLAGIYEENLIIETDDITLTTNNNNPATIVYAAGGTSSTVDIKGKDVLLENFIIERNNGESGSQGINVRRSGVIVKGIILMGSDNIHGPNVIPGIHLTTGDPGSYDIPLDRVVIKDNHISGDFCYGVAVTTYTDASIEAKIEGNIFTDLAWDWQGDEDFRLGWGVMIADTEQVFFGGSIDLKITKNIFDDVHGIYMIPEDDDTGVFEIAVNFNNFLGDANWGVYNPTGFIVDATYNWWGSQDGPSGDGPGSGYAVSANVEFDPWLCEEFPTLWSSVDGVCKKEQAPPPPGTSQGIGVGVTPMSSCPVIIHEEPYAISYFVDTTADLHTTILDSAFMAGFAGRSYAFEGETITFDVYAAHRDGINNACVKLSVLLENDECSGIQAGCVFNNIVPGEYEYMGVTYPEGTIGKFTCTYTVKPAVSGVVGEYWVTVIAEDNCGNGCYDTAPGVISLYLNPAVSLKISTQGDHQFGFMYDLGGNELTQGPYPGDTVYSPYFKVENKADEGSGLYLFMQIYGTDMWDYSWSAALCPDTNKLDITNVDYRASKLNVHQPWTEMPKNYVGRKYIFQEINNFAGNFIGIGDDITMRLRLNIPTPCVGNFQDGGEIVFVGQVI